MLRHWYALSSAGSIAAGVAVDVCAWRAAPRSRVKAPASASTAIGSTNERRWGTRKVYNSRAVP